MLRFARYAPANSLDAAVAREVHVGRRAHRRKGPLTHPAAHLQRAADATTILLNRLQRLALTATSVPSLSVSVFVLPLTGIVKRRI
ncbi:hypothetical protein B0G69_3130 [Paraburkholderia sp. RAU2J]|nr:hypothetical protein B0G69_3130 [Paraburkholderia sp. RAU2J]